MSQHSKAYHQPGRDIPLLGEWDVIVVGGGPSGCAAAIASARRGSKTLLVEKYCFLGGSPAAQFVCCILSTNGLDFQGIWHEWAARLAKYDAIAPLTRSPVRFYPQTQWFRSSPTPEGVKRVWEELVTESGAEILYLTALCGVCRDADSVTGVLVHTRAGVRALMAKRVIDASGDGVVCQEAGVAWNRGAKDKLWSQEVSMMYRRGGESAPGSEGAPPPGTGCTMAFLPERLNRVDRLRVDTLDPVALSATIGDMRREIWRQSDDYPDGTYLVDVATEIGVRTSRIVQGLEQIGEDQAWEFHKSPSGIARSSWELDIHPPDDAPIPERWFHSKSALYAERAARVQAGEYFDIPYRCLVPAGVDQLLVAGRIVSASYLAHGSLRIQQTCMATGEAAGTAAAMSIEAGLTPRELDPVRVASQVAEDRSKVGPAFEILRDLPLTK
jgi:FAD dependent oxidoreductase